MESNRYNFPRVDFLGVPLAACTTEEFISEVLSKAPDPSVSRPLLITYLNAWCSNLAARLPGYRELLRTFDCVYADGQAVVWAAQFLKHPVPERVNAADFIVEFCRRAAADGVSLFLLGGPDGVAAQAAASFNRAVPGLRIVGAESGYFQSPEQEESLLARIVAAAPDVLVVGMGVPLQEEWVFRHAPRTGARTIWCVGAMFEYHSGYRARAPVWVRRAGLEWAFRLLLEPRRLWRRYVIGNTLFVLRVLAARPGIRRAGRGRD